ncbi:hypothetical protein BY996DRAFT_6408133 [Phakopsora pachyrhizi]|uniref:Ribosomal protein mS38 C-terminal domain-containing protein n=1 Tax=Phakopsora pachyrhizi TaxID=170000 RepID=A0AAV0BG06_PHAPC|nr:hypothetical protein BY996DRAFT_6408133 [Phakopsora pachyrhizi]CAH7685329.1 hypothetical protein PPACK8108_LOCUS19829 [Phakopsora pachyrhizi]
MLNRLSNFQRRITNQPIPLKPTNRLAHLRNHRLYSFESGRNRKPDGKDESESDQVKSPESVDREPIKSSNASITTSGRGRRASHRPSSNPYRSRPELALPFEPLSFDRLAHLNPKTLSVDMFFSLQRPLLEIELTSTERRSIRTEPKTVTYSDSDDCPEKWDTRTEEPVMHISTGSPSDPAFKPPLPTSGRMTTSENYIDDEILTLRDAYQAYMITEPEGINPAWSDALKRYLASVEQLVPPPVPEPGRGKNPQRPLAPNSNFQLTEEESKSELKRRRALAYLTPFGTCNSTNQRSNSSTVTSEEAQTNGDVQSDSSDDPLTRISQDPLSLTVQAARFLYSGMMAVRWPTASKWAPVEAQLKEAEQRYATPNKKKAIEQGDGYLPSVRGQERPASTGRRPRGLIHKMPLKIGDKGTTFVVSLSEDQMTQIVKYSEKILRNRIGLENVPKGVLESLERLGEFLLHKHNKRSEEAGLPIIKQTDIVSLDSVFRKKKRKMKVHKYKKRRKARRTLRKRQGRD